MDRIPTLVLGASGYVGGELLRLLGFHPRLELVAAASRSQAGQRIAGVFPHLAPIYGRESFCSLETALDCLKKRGPLAIFSALPHGEAAAVLDRVETAASSPEELSVVDSSSDFRFADPALFERIFQHPHPSPASLTRWSCTLPELVDSVAPKRWAHPGCFTTGVSLAAAPLFESGLASGTLRASAVTGSTGSGRQPKPTTHHPDRHGGFRAYQPLVHRHAEEMRFLLSSLGTTPLLSFVPHSGPFARGIYATLFAGLIADATDEDVVAAYRSWADRCPFLQLLDEPPSLKSVVGTNELHVSLSFNDNPAAGTGRSAELGDSVDHEVVICAALDNLTKGSAGGAIQAMNRCFDWADETGLRLPGLGWH